MPVHVFVIVFYVKAIKNNDLIFNFYLITELNQLSISDTRMLRKSDKNKCCESKIVLGVAGGIKKL